MRDSNPFLFVAGAASYTHLKVCLDDMTKKEWDGIALERVDLEHSIKCLLSSAYVNM